MYCRPIRSWCFCVSKEVCLFRMQVFTWCWGKSRDTNYVRFSPTSDFISSALISETQSFGPLLSAKVGRMMMKVIPWLPRLASGWSYIDLESRRVQMMPHRPIGKHNGTCQNESDPSPGEFLSSNYGISVCEHRLYIKTFLCFKVLASAL